MFTNEENANQVAFRYCGTMDSLMLMIRRLPVAGRLWCRSSKAFLQGSGVDGEEEVAGISVDGVLGLAGEGMDDGGCASVVVVGVGFACDDAGGGADGECSACGEGAVSSCCNQYKSLNYSGIPHQNIQIFGCLRFYLLGSALLGLDAAGVGRKSGWQLV